MSNVIDLKTYREERDYYRKVYVEGRCQECFGAAEFENINGVPICDDCGIDPESEEGKELLRLMEAGEI